MSKAVSENEKLKKEIEDLKKEIENLKNRKTAEMKRNKYGLNWVDVPEAFEKDSENKIPILEEVKEKSIKNDDGKPTHILIEGDNFHALQCLNYTHKGKIDVIYIDPPYNTGKEFVYKDSRMLEKFPNGSVVDSNHPLRHSYWLSFMSKRLKLAKKLLSEKGVIFISIDDNEQANLKLLCDEIFGEKNFVGNIVWMRKRGKDNSAKWISRIHEYLLIYSKNKENCDLNLLELDEETKKAYKNPDNDPRGDYRMLGCWARGTQGGVKYDFTSKDGKYFSERLWLFSKQNLIKMDLENKLIFRGDNVYRKMFIFENKGKIPESIWDDVSNAANASDEIKEMFGDIIFDTPKPIPYIRRSIQLSSSKSSTILDFFAGSGTTMHATMKLNEEDGGHRQCILVQMNENNICEEVTYERNKRVIQGYTNSKGEKVPGLGNSLKYYKTAFIGSNNCQKATDDDRTELAKKAGCLLSLGENILDEIETTDFYQIFTSEKAACGIYFTEDYEKFDEFVEKIRGLSSKFKKVIVYVFSWGNADEFEYDFDGIKNVQIKSIPLPILEIYKSIYNA